MNTPIKLPAGPLVDFYSFTRAIAEAVCPTGEHGLKGIECVTGKLVFVHRSGPGIESMGYSTPGADRSGHIAEDGHPREESMFGGGTQPASDREPQPPVAKSPSTDQGFTLECKLTDADRNDLSKVLERLPPLRYPMPKEEIDVFLTEYRRLSDRPVWVPALVTEATVNRLKDVQHGVLMQHQRALREAHEAGRIASLNEYHVPVRSMMAGTYIAKRQAISYLVQHGLDYFDGADGNKDASVVAENNRAGDNPQTATSNLVTSPIGVSVNTPKIRAAAVKRAKHLRENGAKDFVKQVALEYGVSRKAVSNWIRNAADEQEEKLREARSPYSVFSQRG